MRLRLHRPSLRVGSFVRTSPRARGIAKAAEDWPSRSRTLQSSSTRSRLPRTASSSATSITSSKSRRTAGFAATDRGAPVEASPAGRSNRPRPDRGVCELTLRRARRATCRPQRLHRRVSPARRCDPVVRLIDRGERCARAATWRPARRARRPQMVERPTHRLQRTNCNRHSNRPSDAPRQDRERRRGRQALADPHATFGGEPESPIAARRRPNGSREPVGACPRRAQRRSVSSLSAAARIARPPSVAAARRRYPAVLARRSPARLSP